MFRSFHKATALLKKLRRPPVANPTRRAQLQVEALDQRLVLSAASLTGPVLTQPLLVHHDLAAKHHPVHHRHKHGKQHVNVDLPLMPTGNPINGVSVHLPPSGPNPDLSGDQFQLNWLPVYVPQGQFGLPYGELTINKEQSDGTFVGIFSDQGSGHNLSWPIPVVVGKITNDPYDSRTVDIQFEFFANPAYEFMGLIQTTDKSKYPSWQQSKLSIKGMVDNLQSPTTPQDGVWGYGLPPTPPPPQ
jgi:hypothetical protein